MCPVGVRAQSVCVVGLRSWTECLQLRSPESDVSILQAHTLGACFRTVVGIDPARNDEHVDASRNVQRKSRVSVRPVEALLGRNGWNWLRTRITKSTRCTVWVIPNDGFRCRVSGAVTQNEQRHNRFRVWRPESAVVTCREPLALTFTRSANRRRCSFLVALDDAFRHHHHCNSPRIVPRPRVGEI